MTKFYAIVKEKNENSNCFRFFSSDSYSSKKDFISDLRANGYVVKNNRAYTQEEYDAM
jgi:hypothetical protein